MIEDQLAATVDRAERTWVPASALVLSVKCGGSDYTSGLASNPVVGRVADTLVDLIAPLGVAVHLEASHLCTQMRGVEAHSRTITTFWRGAFQDAELRREFLQEARSHT